MMWPLIITLQSLLYSVSTETLEYQLFQELSEKRSINPHTLPLKNFHNDTVVVDINLRVNHIVGIDETRGVLTLSGWMEMDWKDDSFKWDNNKKFSDIPYILFPSEKAWVPEIFLLNSAEAGKVNIYGKCDLLVFRSGLVIWDPPITVSTVCDLDFTWFPMDEQKCSLIFNSWSYSTNKVDLSTGNPIKAYILTTLFFEEPNEWEITNSTTKRISCFDYEGWACLEFIIKLRRRASYYHLTFVIPCFVALMFTLAIFWFPPSSSEKLVVLSVTNIYLLTFLVHLYWVVPRSGTGVPGIVILSGNMTFFSGLALILSVVSQILSEMNPKVPLPVLLHIFIKNWLGTCFCLQGRKLQVTPKARLHSADNSDLQENEIKSDQEKVASNDWIILATLLDRLCFLLYCLSYFIILIVAFV